MRMGAVLLVLGAQPARQPLRGDGGRRSVEPGADHEARHVLQERPRDRHARQHVGARAPGFTWLLAQEVLDPQDVVEREVAVLALELLRRRVPAEDLSLIHISEPTRLGMISYAV